MKIIDLESKFSSAIKNFTGGEKSTLYKIVDSALRFTPSFGKFL